MICLEIHLDLMANLMIIFWFLLLHKSLSKVSETILHYLKTQHPDNDINIWILDIKIADYFLVIRIFI